ncbi:MAG TPA: hypothetical protein VFF49_02050 [Thermodesulfobacteriota bacterium]|nr:hypothetical protein [Thermodesulfobacteriota bacterium]
MPSRDEHYSKAEHNERFANSFALDSTPYLDWVVTGFFYSAIHYIDSYLAHFHSIHPYSHEDRDDKVRRYLRRINKDYRELKDDSKDARYNMRNFRADEIRNDILPLFNNIKNTITQSLI